MYYYILLHIITSLLRHYYIIITSLLHDYYIIITCGIFHYYLVITLLLHCYYVLLQTHYYILLQFNYYILYIIITYSYIIITSIWRHYAKCPIHVIMGLSLLIITCNNGSIITHYYIPLFVIMAIITHYDHYYSLLLVKDCRTCRWRCEPPRLAARQAPWPPCPWSMDAVVQRFCHRPLPPSRSSGCWILR